MKKINPFTIYASLQIGYVVFMTALFTSIGNLGYSQEQKITISKQGFGVFRPALYQKTIDLEKKDTTYYILLMFQNAKYTSITDTKAIGFFDVDKDSTLIFQFLSDLEAATIAMDNNQAMKWDRKDWTIETWEKWNYIILRDENDSGYCMLTPKYVQMTVDWFQQIGFDYAGYKASKQN